MPLPHTSSGGDSNQPPPDYTVGLATHLLTAVDYLRHAFTIQTHLSRQANNEDVNQGRTSNRMESDHGHSAPFSGLDLDDLTDYIGTSFLPFYSSCGPMVFYVTLLLVAWFVIWYIFESLILACLAFKKAGCSPWILAGFCGKLIWLPFLPFAAAIRERRIQDRMKDLMGISNRPQSPPPIYSTTITVENSDNVPSDWKWEPGVANASVRSSEIFEGNIIRTDDLSHIPRAQVEAILDDTLLASREVDHTRIVWREILDTKALLHSVLRHLGIPHPGASAEGNREEEET